MQPIFAAWTELMHFAGLDALWLLTLDVQPPPAGAEGVGDDHQECCPDRNGLPDGNAHAAAGAGKRLS